METYAVEWTEWVVHRVLFWETDDAKKGRILRALHHFLSYSLIFLVVLAHTLYPAFWLQTLVLFGCGLVWVHHILTHGCVISKVEQKLIGDTGSFLDPFLDLFGIEATERSKQGILMMLSTVAIFVLTLGWFGRLHHKVIPYASAYASAGLRSATALVPHIPRPTSSP
jgi:hypothetical protein